jgi:hypothetical protein
VRAAHGLRCALFHLGLPAIEASKACVDFETFQVRALAVIAAARAATDATGGGHPQ